MAPSMDRAYLSHISLLFSLGIAVLAVLSLFFVGSQPFESVFYSTALGSKFSQHHAFNITVLELQKERIGGLELGDSTSTSHLSISFSEFTISPSVVRSGTGEPFILHLKGDLMQELESGVEVELALFDVSSNVLKPVRLQGMFSGFNLKTPGVQLPLCKNDDSVRGLYDCPIEPRSFEVDYPLTLPNSIITKSGKYLVVLEVRLKPTQFYLDSPVLNEKDTRGRLIVNIQSEGRTLWESCTSYKWFWFL